VKTGECKAICEMSVEMFSDFTQKLIENILRESPVIQLIKAICLEKTQTKRR
jgi:hypothetical protein